jgi:hypothetical protein
LTIATAEAGAQARAAITLVEVLLGIVILVLGLVPVLTLYSSEERESAFISQKLLVTNHLRELADRTQSECITSRFARRAFEHGPRERALGGAGAGLSIFERVQVYPSEESPGLWVVRVEARWQDPSGALSGWREQVMLRLICDPEWGSRHGVPARSHAGTLAATEAKR